MGAHETLLSGIFFRVSGFLTFAPPAKERDPHHLLCIWEKQGEVVHLEALMQLLLKKLLDLSEEEGLGFEGFYEVGISRDSGIYLMNDHT